MSIDTGNGGAATGCPCGCGAAEKAHCWRESDWEANGRADEIVSALAAAVEGRRGDALRIAHAIGDKTVEAAVGMILRVPGMEQTSREAHQAIAREKARTMIARDGAEVLRGEIERLRAMFVQPAVVTEDVGHLGTQWGVSFDGLDPAPEHHVRVASREDAFRLKALVDRMRAEIAIREDGVQQAKGDVEALRAVIVRANNALFAVGPDIQDAEHAIECHADTVPAAYLRLAKGAAEAWSIVAAVVADMVEPKESA